MANYTIPSNPDAPLAPHFYVNNVQDIPRKEGYLIPQTTIIPAVFAPSPIVGNGTGSVIASPLNNALTYTLPFILS